MNKLIIFTTIFVFILVIFLPLSLTFSIRYIPGDIQPSLTNTEKIYDQSILSQSFISPKDNLAGIGVSIKNPNFANKKDAKVNIYDENNNLIRTTILNGKNIADGKFVKIFFEPIKDSYNKKFTWSISSPDSQFEDALEIFLTDKRPLWSKQLKVGDKLTVDSLSYITLHKPKTFTQVMNLVTSSWIDKFSSDRPFFIIYSLIILLFLGLVVLISSKSLPQNLKIS